MPMRWIRKRLIKKLATKTTSKLGTPKINQHRANPPSTSGSSRRAMSVSYTHLRAHETRHDLVCRLLLEKKKKRTQKNKQYTTLKKKKQHRKPQKGR